MAGEARDVRLPFRTASTGSRSSSSVISPLALPRGATGYFDLSTVGSRNSTYSQKHSVYSPLSPGAHGPALSHLPPQFLSPHLMPTSRDLENLQKQQQQQQQRSASVPPNLRGSKNNASRRGTAMIPPPRSVPVNSVGINGSYTTSSFGITGSGYPRTNSTDSESSLSHDQTIRRLVKQNERIREAWEAERKYMEANRERAEEVYKEERAFMEDERLEWAKERDSLLQEIARLRKQVETLGGSGPRFSLTNTRSGAFGSIAHTSLCGGGAWETSPESMRSSQSSQGSGNTLNAASQSSSNALLSSTTIEPLPLRTLPEGYRGIAAAGGSSDTTSLTDSVTSDSSEPVPIVDVQEIHPELEGIPIKATMVQKPTFTDISPSKEGSKEGSRSPSPPSGTRLSPSNVQTLQVLAAHEEVRLTMHAGHTPSHSLSIAATVDNSGTATVRSESGDSTPTLTGQAALGIIQQADGAISIAAQESVSISRGLGDVTGGTEPFPSMIPYSSQEQQFGEDGHPEAQLDAGEEDRPLKGPLMVRNMPAHDEIFFRRLSDKLEEVSKDITNLGVPSVLKEVDENDDVTNSGESEAPAPPAVGYGHLEAATFKTTTRATVAPRPLGVTSHGDNSKAGSRRTSKGDSDVEEGIADVPLKLKKSCNFGAPFGEFR